MGMCNIELDSTNGRITGLNIDEEAFLVLKSAGIIRGRGCHRSAKLCVDEWGLRLSLHLDRRPVVGPVGRSLTN